MLTETRSPWFRLGCAVLLAFSRLSSAAQTEEPKPISHDALASLDSLEAGFSHPPVSARPQVWWHWVNGCVSKEGITADLESMKRIGLSGATIFTVQQTLVLKDGTEINGPVIFMTPEWRALIRHAIAEANRLGLELSTMNCEGWGQAGGPTVMPAESMQKVVWTESRIAGGRKIPLNLPQPETVLGHYRDIALLALPTDPGDVTVVAPLVTTSLKDSRPFRFTNPGGPVLVLPLPVPDAPQWVRLEFDRQYTFSSLKISINRMRDTPDPENWEASAFLSKPDQEFLKSLKGPRRWELQVSRDGKTFETAAPVATHGTSTFAEVRGRVFRIWMPVPPPLAESLPLARSEKVEIKNIILGGPRIDKPEARTGQIINDTVDRFSTPSARPGNDRLPSGDVITLTGKKEWDAPPGNWTLLRLGHTTTGARIAAAKVGGLECDKLSRTAVMNYLQNGMLATVLRDAGPMAGTTLKNLQADSWEHGYENWTPMMREEFLRRRGYSMDPWLPALAGYVVGSSEFSERFLWDFRRTIADLVAENYYGTMQEVARQHKMGVSAEAVGHGLPAVVDQLQCKGRVDIPMGEFWVARRDVDDNKEAASAAHIYGKKIVGSESFTAAAEFAAWARDPASLKSEGDLQFCMGINLFYVHRFAHQPWLDRSPGMTLGQWGTNFERTNTWWEQASEWMAYLARCMFLLRQGVFVADVCYYYGEGVPVSLAIRRLSPPPPPGLDFDACNTEKLREMQVVDGRITLPGGMSYRVLVLPDRDRMTADVLGKVRDLARAGATVVGPRPMASPSLTGFPQSDRMVREMADDLWGDCDGRAVTSHTYGAGSIQWGRPLAEAVGVPPDFSSDVEYLKFIHRRNGSTEIYFISNQSDRNVLAHCCFRVGSLSPEIWHPDTGLRETPAIYSSRGGRTVVPIQFGAADSLFVVFRFPADPDPVASVSTTNGSLFASSGSVSESDRETKLPIRKNGKILMSVSKPGSYIFSTTKGRTLSASTHEIPQALGLTGPWHVRFPPNLGAPPSATFDRLESWTDASDEGIRYFSGTATYQRELLVPESWLRAGLKCYLDLGAVRNVAQVFLNGQDCGILWKAPFRVEITRALRADANRLEVKVTNLWCNRLIGDLRQPGNKAVTWTTYNPYRADSELVDSGLLGPVRLEASELLEAAP